MDEGRQHEAGAAGNRTTVERRGERELVATRSFDAPARTVFEAWTRPELFERWWPPKSMGMSVLSCAMDVRPGGSYRLEFGGGGAATMAFFGRYREVMPNARLVWTNDESADGAVTTVTFEERGGTTLLVLHELYPSTEARDISCAGSEGALPESFAQLDALLA